MNCIRNLDVRPPSRIGLFAIAGCLAAMLSGCGIAGGERALVVPEDLLQGKTPSLFCAESAESALDCSRELGYPPYTAPVLAAGIRLDADGQPPSSEFTTDAYIKDLSFSSTASHGPFNVRVTYVVHGEEQTVEFHDQLVPDDPEMGRLEEGYRDHPTFEHSWERIIGGTRYWSWHYAAHPDLRVSVGFINGVDVDNDNEDDYFLYATGGLRTHPADLPSGTAVYEGSMRGSTHLANDPSSGYQSIYGDFELSAHFDTGALQGRIDGIRVGSDDPRWDHAVAVDPPRGENGLPPLSPTTYFAIENGRIVDGEFSAELRGMDSNANAPLDETVRGYEGGVLGEFYGPRGTEVGGVLNARREDRVMAGLFGGVQQ